MKTTKLQELAQFGQSGWLDFISRRLILSGKLSELISLGLLGMTSNPTIFSNAISTGNDYDEEIKRLSLSGRSPFEIYDTLTIHDISMAADLFMPIYKDTGGRDGYVSLEINPLLAHSTTESIEEGKRLQRKANRPNVMFKVPATDEGYFPMEQLTASGINVNVTLIFSLEQYEKTAQAYLKGMKRFVEAGENPQRIHSVASVFVSRIDTAVDALLEEKIRAEKDPAAVGKMQSLLGKAGCANAALIYGRHQEIFSSSEFLNLQEKGANYQRVLFGSTGTKNPVYSDIKYIQELMFKHTVNTIPQATLDAFLDHGFIKDAYQEKGGEAAEILKNLSSVGINIDDVCKKLLDDGVKAFSKSFNSLITDIEMKTKQLLIKQL